MSNQVISYADLSIINNALKSISNDLNGVNSELGSLNVKHDLLENELDQLIEAFKAFVKEDRKHKSLQLAETRVGNLRQELQIKYGYYAEVRRMATGILQGVDTGVVSDDTLKFTTEEVMIKAPGYWLAPALVALASWIRNDKTIADKALNESLKRDDYKTTLLFMLIMRRLNRSEASLKWLERYFMHQNPYDLDREFIIVLEAITTGVFSPSSRQLMMSNVSKWLNQLTQGDNFVDEQKSQWRRFFESKGPLYTGNYPLLEKFAINWHLLETTLRDFKSHEVIKAHFENIFSSSSDHSRAVKVQLDELLTLLVTNFDDEELPLQEQVRLNQLIIQMNGDTDAATAVLDTEKHIFEEKVDFLQMLTNAAFNPELSGATKVSQALAVSISQPWIIDSYELYTAEVRMNEPSRVYLNIGSFTCETKDGSNEEDLIAEHTSYFSNLLVSELKKLSFPTGNVIIGAILCLGGIGFLSSVLILGLIGIGIGGVMIWKALSGYNKLKANITNHVEEQRTKSKEVLRGCLAETVDYRRELVLEDPKAERVREQLKNITPENFSSVSRETARSII